MHNRYIRLCFTVVIFTCILAAVFLDRRLPSISKSSLLPLIDLHEFQMTESFGKCDGFTEKVWRGFWREKAGLAKRDYMERQTLDENIRVAMNWPAKLYRNDSRLYDISSNQIVN